MDKHFDDEKLTYDIIGCAMRVHSELGCGFQEVIYQRALGIELKEAGLEYQREFEMPIRYKGQFIGERRVDFLIAGISVELKALTQLEDVHLAQAMNYLEAYGIETGLLLNFGATKLQFHRLRNRKFKMI
jgi:GxxExxY protein